MNGLLRPEYARLGECMGPRGPNQTRYHDSGYFNRDWQALPRIIFMQKCEWMPPKLTNEIIDAAIEGFEQQKRRIDEQISELRAARSGSPAQSASAPAKQPRRKMSAAGRKAIAEAQRKRWAASKGQAEPKAPKPAKKAKRKLSAEGRANIVAALKKRWAAKKAASKK
jgi:hypothetical protein